MDTIKKDLVIQKPGQVILENPEIKPGKEYGLRMLYQGGLVTGRTTRSSNLQVKDGRAIIDLQHSEIENLKNYQELNYNLFCLTDGKDVLEGSVKVSSEVANNEAEQF